MNKYDYIKTDAQKMIGTLAWCGTIDENPAILLTYHGGATLWSWLGQWTRDSGYDSYIEFRDSWGLKSCEHDWIDARNEVVLSGEYCRHCGKVRATKAV